MLPFELRCERVDFIVEGVDHRPYHRAIVTERKRSNLKTALLGIAGLLALLVAYLTLWPIEIDPVAWQPAPAPPLDGALAQNDALTKTELLAVDKVHGPEDVAVDQDGRIYVGTHDGKIVSTDGTEVKTIADTEGRPLGLAWDKDGVLIVADAIKGLLSVTKAGLISVLSTESDGVPFRFTDDVDVASDGRIYFSDASHKFGYGNHMADIMEGRGNGRLLRYDPTTKKTETLLGDLCFANGVAVAADDSYVLVNETGRYRIRRYWLTGAKAGSADTFYENLPGFPDGVSRSPRGTYWVAMFTVRNADADKLAPSAFMKKMMWRLPKALLPKPAPVGLVIELDADGKVLRSLHDTSGSHFATITSAEEVDGKLYLGTLHAAKFGRLTL
jgi:sugar lactone lactonase YvrE